MPAKDLFHEVVKRALERKNGTIPYENYRHSVNILTIELS